jgi:protocatechuate 3,4-dioxygenase beta subunit
MRTDAAGHYQFDTIRPGSYDNNAAQIHYVVRAPAIRRNCWTSGFRTIQS